MPDVGPNGVTGIDRASPAEPVSIVMGKTEPSAASRAVCTTRSIEVDFADGVHHRHRAGRQRHVEGTQQRTRSLPCRKKLDDVVTGRHVGRGELAVGDVAEHDHAVYPDVGRRHGGRVGHQDPGLAGTDRFGRGGVGGDHGIAAYRRRTMQNDVLVRAGLDLQRGHRRDVVGTREVDLMFARTELERPEHIAGRGTCLDRLAVDADPNRRVGHGLDDRDHADGRRWRRRGPPSGGSRRDRDQHAHDEAQNLHDNPPVCQTPVIRTPRAAPEVQTQPQED